VLTLTTGKLARIAAWGAGAATGLSACAGTLALPASAVAAKPKPPFTVHAIFDGDAHAPFRVGQIVDVLAAPGKPGPGRITKVCFSPAPIARPACSKFAEAAPSAVGTTKITVSFSRRRPYTLEVKVLPAATKVGGDQGGLAVPATITCPSVSLYTNVHSAQTNTGTPSATLTSGTKVALYNVIAPGVIVMVDYATGANGFGEQSCATPGLSSAATGVSPAG
jgi:hypothetical protein